MEYVLFALVLGFVLAVAGATILGRARFMEYERGLRYVRGRFRGVLAPGQYWYVRLSTTMERVDVRPRFVSITGQEVLSSDGVTLKVSLAACYEITDPATAVNKVQDYQNALYLELQLALRDIIGSADIDSLLGNREDLSKRLLEMTRETAEKLGLTLISVGLKDIMFPGKLKEVFAQVVNARKEGLAALEKARGETAALRNLANAARTLESNPSLAQLRMVQALCESSGNTLVLGMPSHTASGLTEQSASQEPG